MSMLDSLWRFVDPIEFRKKQEERRQKRKVQPPGVDDDVELPPARPDGKAPPLVCRVCGYSGGPEHRFCPRCLAETMERRR